MALEKIYKRKSTRKRYSHTFFGPYLEPFSAPLLDQGYQPPHLRRYIQILTKFGEFLSHERVKTVKAIRQDHVEAFLRSEEKGRPSTKWKYDYLSLAQHVIQKMLQFLATQDLWVPELQSSAFPLVEEFLQMLSRLRGLRPVTIDGYRHSVLKFLEYLGDDGTGNQLQKLTLSQIDQYIVSASNVYQQKTISSIGVCLRKFLQFLYHRGVVQQNFGPLVYLPQFTALARLPCALPLDKIRTVFTFIDTSTAKGRRDMAILQLLVTYGVRPGEIVKLRLEDVDWRNETIAFRRAKQGRTLHFPLTREVGEALLNYLRNGRSVTKAREIFIRLAAPYVSLSRGPVVSNLVRLYLTKAGITQDPRGAYLFRHSLAVHLVRKGHPLKTLSDMLGHQDPRSAYCYTKLALEDLSQVCLSVKEVLP